VYFDLQFSYVKEKVANAYLDFLRSTPPAGIKIASFAFHHSDNMNCVTRELLTFQLSLYKIGHYKLIRDDVPLALWPLVFAKLSAFSRKQTMTAARAFALQHYLFRHKNDVLLSGLFHHGERTVRDQLEKAVGI
jgi:hypothetical protein